MRTSVSARMMSALLVLVALAGCSQTSDPADEQADHIVEAGTLRGVVVDEAIQPVHEAEVVVAKGEETQSTLTDEVGAFSVEDLEPGAYTLTVSKAGYVPEQLIGQVRSEAVAEILKVVLTRDAEDKPFIAAEQFQGYLTCGVHDGDHDGTDCGLGERALLFACDLGAPCIPSPFPDRAVFFSSVDRKGDWIHGELVWQPSTAYADQMEVMPFVVDNDGGVVNNSIHSPEGPSPLPLDITTKEIEDNNLWNGSAIEYQFRVGPPQGGLATITVQQDFEFFLFTFYNFRPDEDWLFARDGPHPLP